MANRWLCFWNNLSGKQINTRTITTYYRSMIDFCNISKSCSTSSYRIYWLVGLNSADLCIRLIRHCNVASVFVTHNSVQLATSLNMSIYNIHQHLWLVTWILHDGNKRAIWSMLLSSSSKNKKSTVEMFFWVRQDISWLPHVHVNTIGWI